ncbi:MAG: glycosyltransferase family 39 protein [Bacteroidota bacterium]
MASRFFTKPNLELALLIISSVTALTFYNRFIQSDDNWFGEQAYWLAYEGQVKLKSIPGIFDWENQFLVYHKLLIWIGALIVRFVGWSVYYLKSFNLLCLVLSTLVMKEFVPSNRRVKLLSILLLILAPITLVKSFEFRPEIPAMMFGVFSYYFLYQFSEKRSYYTLLLGGLCAGLAFLTHLNGVIFCVAGGILLIYMRKWIGVLLFTLIGLSTCLIYFIPLVLDKSLEVWYNNLKNWPSHQFKEIENGSKLLLFLKKLISEQKRYFWDETVAIGSSIFFLAIIMKGKTLWNKHRQLMVYVGLLVLSLAIIGSHKAARYLMLILPFMAIISALSLKYICQEKKWKPMTMIILLVLQFLAFGFTTYKVFDRNIPHVEKHADILSNLPQGTTVIGPWELIYNEIDNYRIFNFKTYEYLQERQAKPFTALRILEDLNKRQIEYIILDKIMKEEERHWFRDWVVPENEMYEEFYRSENYLILKRNRPYSLLSNLF